MRDESTRLIEKGRKLLAEAGVMLPAGLTDAAARSAYLAALNAARALVFEDTGRLVKTHRGVITEFARMTRNIDGIDPDVRGFLSRGYAFKTIADYEFDPDLYVTAVQAEHAILTATRFLAWAEAFLTRQRLTNP